MPIKKKNWNKSFLIFSFSICQHSLQTYPWLQTFFFINKCSALTLIPFGSQSPGRQLRQRLLSKYWLKLIPAKKHETPKLLSRLGVSRGEEAPAFTSPAAATVPTRAGWQLGLSLTQADSGVSQSSPCQYYLLLTLPSHFMVHNRKGNKGIVKIVLAKLSHRF